MSDRATADTGPADKPAAGKPPADQPSADKPPAGTAAADPGGTPPPAAGEAAGFRTAAPTAAPTPPAGGGAGGLGTGRGRGRSGAPRAAVLTAALAVLLLCAFPFYLDAFWLKVGLFAMAASIGAIGLNLLTGTTGQLSLGHAFFLAVGAYGYVWLAGDPGLGLPTPVALVLAVCLTGLAGGLFSPISGRLRGMYLGVATLALVFLGHHVMLNAESVTGGFNGRVVPPMSLGGFTFTDTDPYLAVLGVPFGAVERLWYLGLVLLAVAWWTARNLLRGRPGRALAAVRDSEVAASVLGVPVGRYRSAAFVVSSMYAGLAGAMVALVSRSVVPDYFGLTLSIDYLAMIVIGGLGSVGGAAAGAVFVTALPLIMGRYADQLPLIAAPGAGDHAVGPAEAARYLYGAAIILILLYAPGGLSGLLRRPPRTRGTAPAARTRSRIPLRTRTRTTSRPKEQTS